VKTIRQLVLALLCMGFGLGLGVGSAASGGELKITPSQRNGIQVSVRDEAGEGKPSKLQCWVLITRESLEAARAANFTVTVKDAKGRELAKAAGKDLTERITHKEGARWRTLIEMSIDPPPAWPLTVTVEDAVEKETARFVVKPKDPGK
jgi:hypothetical protein